MTGTKADIIAQLKKDILPLQGFKKKPGNNGVDAAIGPLKNAFPNASFPLAAVHEFLSIGKEESAATTGFISVLLAALMKDVGATIWISSYRNIFPPALKSFGIIPDKIIFIHLNKQQEICWAMEEALKCRGVAAVIGEMPEISFTISRRLQLAVEHSGVTGFILRNNPKNINTTACVTRWKITPIPSQLEGGMPGVGFPRWKVELLKVRNGYPANWEIEFVGGRMKQVTRAKALELQQPRKAV
jgi:protein ImuA